MKTALAFLLIVALSISLWIGARRQQTELQSEVSRLTRGAASEDAPQSTGEDIHALPAPVARYLRWALPDRRQIELIRLSQVGTLRTDTHTERWMRFEAEHVAAPHAIGFVWNARVAIVPLLHVRVRDSFLEGSGSSQVSLLSAFTVASDAGMPEMNEGALHRFLAEAVWYPTALRPSAGLKWTPTDENTALATLTTDGVSVSLEFRFADTGEVTGIFTPARWGKFDDGYRQVPWEGHFRNYEMRDGILVPTEADVGWYVDDEWRAVWKGTITAFDAERPK